MTASEYKAKQLEILKPMMQPLPPGIREPAVLKLHQQHNMQIVDRAAQALDALVLEVLKGQPRYFDSWGDEESQDFTEYMDSIRAIITGGEG